MKRFFAVVVLGVLLGPVAFAADQPPSDASIKALLDSMHASSLMDNVWGQMQGMMDASVRQASEGQPMNEAQKAIAKDMTRQMTDIFRSSMSWAKLEPVMVDVYKRSLSQSEVDGMVRFYRSPAGKAVIQKMPLIMQNTMQAMQGMTQDMMPKIQKVAQESAERMKAAATTDTAGGDAAKP